MDYFCSEKFSVIENQIVITSHIMLMRISDSGREWMDLLIDAEKITCVYNSSKRVMEGDN